MFRSLFSPDSPLMITMSQVTDCIFLSLFWILGTFPLVTAGAAGAALYDAAVRGMGRSQRDSWQRFFRSFRQNLKPGILPGLLVLAAVYLLARGAIALWNAAATGSLPWHLFAAGAVVLVLLLGAVSWILPVLSRFENTGLLTLKNALLLALAHTPRTLALGLVWAAAGWVSLRWLFPVLFVPALASWLSGLLLEGAFRPFEESRG